MNKYFLFIFFFFISTVVKALDIWQKDDCINKRDEFGDYWARQVSRSQGRGWIWFPGQGTSRLMEDAVIIAEGRSLDTMMLECPIIHREIQENERCIEKHDDVFIVYVRLNILSDFCRESYIRKHSSNEGIVNKKFTEVYRKYKAMLLAEKTSTREGCNNIDTTKCSDYGEFALRMGLVEEGLTYLDRGCMSGNKNDCLTLGKYFKTSDLEKAKRYLKISCKAREPLACYDLVKIETNENEKFDYMVYACDLQVAEVCYLLADYFELKKRDIQKADDYYREACTYGYTKACPKVKRPIINTSEKDDLDLLRKKLKEKNVETTNVSGLPL